MKKEFVITVLISMFMLQIAIATVIAQDDTTEDTSTDDPVILMCNDSDNGLNYGVQGTMTDELGETFTDYCEDNKTLYEYSCPKKDCVTKNVCGIESLDPDNTDAKVQIFYKINDVQAIIDNIDMGITLNGFIKIFSTDDLTHSLLFKKDGYKECTYNTTFVSGNFTKLSISLVKLDSKLECSVIVENLGFTAGSKNVCSKKEVCKETLQNRNFTCVNGCEEGVCLIEKKIVEAIKNLSSDEDNTLLENIKETNSCPEISYPDCRYGQLINQGPDSGWCPQGPKCIKKLTDGSEALIKFSSDKAIELARKQYGDVDFRLDLVETTLNGKSIAAYKLDGEKVTRFLIFFKKRTPISINVNAETGEIVA